MSDLAPTGSPLVPLPAQPAGVPWPVETWAPAPGPPPVGLEALLDLAFDPAGPLAHTYAVVVVQHGRLVAERYGGALPHLDGPAEPVGADTELLSWSMAKSVLHALVGILVGQDRLAVDLPPPGLPWWDPARDAPAAADDPRRSITLEQLLEMRDGLDFNEDYVDDRISDTIAMLFGDGKDDVVAYAASRPVRCPAGQRFNYSSGTSNLVSAGLAAVLGGGQELARWADRHLFGPVGMRSARLGLDPAGTWVGSSYAYATARDWARFGYLYLRDGCWDGQRVLPPGWVDHGRRPRSVDPTDGSIHAAHWWVVDDGRGTFWASGYTGQAILVCPALDLVLVRLGNTEAARYPDLADWRRRLVQVFDPA